MGGRPSATKKRMLEEGRRAGALLQKRVSMVKSGGCAGGICDDAGHGRLFPAFSCLI